MDAEKKRSLEIETSGKDRKKVRSSNENKTDLSQKKEETSLVEGSKVLNNAYVVL